MSIEAALRLTRVHAYPRDAGRLNLELDRVSRKLPPRPDRKDAAHYRKQKATPAVR